MIISYYFTFVKHNLSTKSDILLTFIYLSILPLYYSQRGCPKLGNLKAENPAQ